MRAGSRFTVVLICLAAALESVSCGVPLDDHPRAIQSAVSTTTSPDLPPANGVRTFLYYIVDESLVPIPATVPDGQVSTLLSELLKPSVRSYADIQLRTAIPSGTMLLSASQKGTLLTVDLSSEFENLVGVSRQRALGQIVMSVTQVGTISQVRFKINGEDVQVTSPLRGDVSTVEACDYKSMLSTADQFTAAASDKEPLLVEVVVRTLEVRRNEIDRRCTK